MKDYSKLTDEQLRIAVAKALGWTYDRHEGGTYRSDDPANWTWFHPTICAIGCGFGGVPNYPHCLNACHEFEEALGDGQKAEYGRALFDILGLVERMNAWGWFDLAHATARQRCVALLAVLKPE